MVRRFFYVLALILALMASCKEEDSPISNPRPVSKQQVAWLLSELPLGVEQMEEVFDAVSSSSENGYDEDYMFYGAVFEYFPLKDTRDVRLHASWSSNSFGDNFINVGVTWKFDMTSAVKYLTGRKDR